VSESRQLRVWRTVVAVRGYLINVAMEKSWAAVRRDSVAIRTGRTRELTHQRQSSSLTAPLDSSDFSFVRTDRGGELVAARRTRPRCT